MRSYENVKILFDFKGHEDKDYGKFLKWFVNGGRETAVDGKTWEVLGISHSTRDVSVVHGKIDHLVARFSYRILFFVNEDGSRSKHYIDTPYDGLRRSLENIIRNNLMLTNSVVIAAVTVWKDEEIISLLSKAYGFSMDRYFRQINGEYSGKKGIVGYGRYAAR